MKKLSAKHTSIFHYTTEEGLYGILESGQLWATHYKFLNDHSEFSLYKDKLIEYISAHKEIKALFGEIHANNSESEQVLDYLGGIDAVVRNDVETVIDLHERQLFNTLEGEFYICSFCAASDDSALNGLLSQWRGYGGNGGYAIQVDSKALEEMLSEESQRYALHLSLSNCVYSDDTSFFAEFDNELKSISSFLYQIFLSTRNNSQTQETEQLASDAFSAFVSCMSRYKHKAFKEENEIRLVATIFKDFGDSSGRTSKTREFRKSTRSSTPFIKIFDEKNKLPIQRIIVGPNKDKELRAESLRIWLRNKNIESIDVTVSDIPYI